MDDDHATRTLLERALVDLETTPSTTPTLELDDAVVRRHFEAQVARADSHYAKGEYVDAERLYLQILDSGETSESVRLYASLGQCREHIGDTDGAIEAYRRYLELDRESDTAAGCGFMLGNLLLFTKDDPVGAESALTVATGSSVVDFRARATFWLGTIAHNRRDIETALRRYREVFALRDEKLTILPSTIPAAALNIAEVLRERGQVGEAARMYEYTLAHEATVPVDRAEAEQLLRTLRG